MRFPLAVSMLLLHAAALAAPSTDQVIREFQRAYLFALGREASDTELSRLNLSQGLPANEVFQMKKEALRAFLYTHTPVNQIRVANRACSKATGIPCSEAVLQEALEGHLLFQELVELLRNRIYAVGGEGFKAEVLKRAHMDALGRPPSDAEVDICTRNRAVYATILENKRNGIYAGGHARYVMERAFAVVKNRDLLSEDLYEAVAPQLLVYKEMVQLFQRGDYTNTPSPGTKVGIALPHIGYVRADEGTPYIETVRGIGGHFLRTQVPLNSTDPTILSRRLRLWLDAAQTMKDSGLKHVAGFIPSGGDTDDECNQANYRPPTNPEGEPCERKRLGTFRFSKTNVRRFAAYVKAALAAAQQRGVPVDYVEIGNELNHDGVNGDIDPAVPPTQQDANRLVAKYYEVMKELRAVLPPGHPPLIFSGQAGCESQARWEEAEFDNGPSIIRNGCLPYARIARAVANLNKPDCGAEGCEARFWSMLDGVNLHAYLRTRGADAATYAQTPSFQLYRQMLEQMQGQADMALTLAREISQSSRNKPVYFTELGVEMLPAAPAISKQILRYMLGHLANLGPAPVVTQHGVIFDPNAPRVPVPLIAIASSEQVASRTSAETAAVWGRYSLRQNGVWQPAKALLEVFNNP